MTQTVKRFDVIAFLLACVAVYLAPQPPLRIPGVPAHGVPMGTFVLALWAVLVAVARVRVVVTPPPLALLFAFAAYLFLVSLVSERAYSVAYAAQYVANAALLAIVFGRILYVLRRYPDAKAHFLRTIYVVGIVYAVGVLVSLYTGPFYPWEVLWHQRRLGSVMIPLGVGFAESHHGAAGIVGLFLLFSLTYGRVLVRSLAWRTLWLVVEAAALAATFSRSGVLATMIGAVVLQLASGKGLLRLRGVAAAAAMATVALLLVHATPSVVGSYSLSVVSGDIRDRLAIGSTHLAAYLEHGWPEQVFGLGMRGSSAVDSSGFLVSPHNQFLAALEDGGILGLLLLVGTFAALAAMSRRTGPAEKRLTLGAVALLLVHNMTETYFYDPAYVFFFAILTALARACRADREDGAGLNHD